MPISKPLMNKSQSLADWLCYLESIHPANIEMGLDRVGHVAEQLNLVDFDAQVITVAGTNGKGSTCALLEQILLDAGYNVGVTSSPHIQDYRERVRINGKMLSEQAHVDSFDFIESGRSDTSLTYFEYTTLSALKLFQDAKLDVVILEIGLGGRFDAANIVDADVAVITTIDIDHADWLGTDKAVIAREKSGIFRSYKMAICGVHNPPATIDGYAQEIGANLIAVDHDYVYQQSGQQWCWQSQPNDYIPLAKLNGLTLPKLPLQNAATAVAAIKALSLPVPESAIRSGVANARLAGRMQQVGHSPQQYLDVAHNPESARYLATQLQALKALNPEAKMIAVVGMLKDKDISASLSALVDGVDVWHIAGLQCERAANSEQVLAGLQSALEDGANHVIKTHATMAEAWQHSIETADPKDIIIGFGSFFTVAEITQHISG